MSTSSLIMWAAAMFLLGWLVSYFFIRQIMYNFIIALPMIRKMNALQDGMIAIGAKRYTTVSSVICVVLTVIVTAVVIRYARLALIISFAAGAVIAVIMMINMVSLKNRAMFEKFCDAYYSFIPDDELRTAVYGKDLTRIRSRLKEIGVSGTFIPEFQKR